MIVEYSADDGLRLIEPNDFRNFKLRVQAGGHKGLTETEGITFVDDHNALVAIPLVRTLRGCPGDEDWHTSYLAMVEVARKYGWIDEQGRAIRAHIEREAEGCQRS